MYCRLCLFQAQILIPLRDEGGNVSTEILGTVEKYTGVQLASDDCICVSCWASVDNFRKFCLLVGERQAQYAYSRELVAQPDEIFGSAEEVTAMEKDANTCLESLNENRERTNESAASGRENNSREFEPKYRSEKEDIKLEPENILEYDFACTDSINASERSTYVSAIEELPIFTEAEHGIANRLECPETHKQEMCSEDFYLQQKRGQNEQVDLLSTQNDAAPNKIQAEAISNSNEASVRRVEKAGNQEKDSIPRSTRKTGRPRRSDAANQAAEDHFIASHMQLVCELCKFEADNFKALKDHFKTLHNSNGYVVCCQKRLYKRGILIDHINVHHNAAHFSCTSCGSHFADRLCLRNHQLLKHQQPAESPLECSRFAKVRFVQRHVRKHADAEEKSLYTCELCGKEAATRVALKAHKRLCQTSERRQRQRQHICGICERIFKTTRRLREHMATHTGELLYRCNYCDKRFKFASNLYPHQKWKHPAEWAKDQSIKASKKTI